MRVSIRGININYVDNGDSENTLLLLHGWGSSIAAFKNTIDNLSLNMRIIALDLPGFGGTDEPPCAWSVDDYAQFVCEFINSLGINHLSLLGHSFGGRIIIKLASYSHLPFILDKLVLVDSAGIKHSPTFKARVKLLKYKTGRWLLSLPLMTKLYPNALNSLRSSHGSADYKNASPRMRECLVRAVNEDLTELLSRITCSTLLIWGDMDSATPISDAKTMEDLIPNAGLVVLHGSGHFSFVEQPFVFIKVLRSYFNINQ